MLANSWLYHYYSVQSKIQFGLPYDGPPTNRVPATPSYYHPTPTIPSSLTHSYVTSHHMPYGYHSPVGIPPHQSSPGLIGHHNGQQIGSHSSAGEHYRPYAYRTEPVDYSQTTTPIPINSQVEPRCSSTNSSVSGSHRIGSPPSKRRAIARLEPLYIPENPDSLDTSMVELHSQHSHESDSGGGNGVDGGGSTVLLTTVIPTRHRFYTKAIPADPGDFMEQWNPSPPWSETAQKVPDIMQQELSPYLTTTPPTPTSAPPPSSHGPAFSFDWMPEQFVPIMDCPPSCLPMPVSMQLQMSHWPTDHRLLCTQSLDRHHDEDTIINGE